MIPKILIVMGSDSDLPAFEDARKMLDEFGVDHKVQVMSAHRTPKLVTETIENLADETKVIIAGAGGAAHLAGVVAAHTIKPVIGVPMTSALDGLDSLLSTAQMPAGIPVATVAIGKAGATNAAILACQILALSDSALTKKLQNHRIQMRDKVIEKNKKLGLG
jgi:5-(carboxyamino)imidazole ribonucleotide mutase